MRRLIIIFSAIVMAVAAVSIAAQQLQVLENFEAGHEWRVVKGDERGADCVVVDSPMRQGKSLRVTWTTQRDKYAEPHLTTPLPAACFDTSSNPYHGQIDIDVFSPGTAEPRFMSVRLLDSANEAFQWMVPVDLKREGWQTIHFDIRPDNVRSNWGGSGKTPHVMDGAVRLMGITIDFDRELVPPDDARHRQIIVDNIVLHLPGSSKPPAAPAAHTEGDAPAGAIDVDALQVGLDTGDRMHLLDPTSPRPAYLTIRNTLAQAQLVQLDLHARSLLGHSYDFKQNVALPVNGIAQQFLPLPQDKQDFWWVYYTLTDPQGKLPERRGRVMLGVMSPVGNTPQYQPEGRFLFGVCAHTGRYEDQTMQDEAYAAGLIGLDIMRTGTTWGTVQQNGPDSWDWSKMDRIVELYKAQNIQIQYLLAYTPQWASTGDQQSKDWLDWSRTAPRLDAWQTFVRNAAARYHKDVRFWEQWNEPDLEFFRGTPDEYVAMCDAAYPILKSVDPGLTVMSGGFSGLERKPGFLDDVMPRVRDNYDVLAIHIHGMFGEFQRAVDGRWNQLHEQYASDKPIYYNETGMYSPRDTVEADTAQAVTLVCKLTFAMARGAIAYNWYDLRDDGDDPADAEHRFGLITRDFCAKPAYLAYNNLVRQLRGYKFVRQIDGAKDQWLFLFEKDDSYVLVGWAQQPYAVGELVVQTDAKDVKCVDMLGNDSTLNRLSDGSVVMSLQPDPTYWVFDKATTPPQWRDQLLHLVGVPAFVPGQSNTLTFEFANPLNHSSKLTFEARLPGALGGGTTRIDETIAAGATKTLQLPVNVTTTDVDYAKPFTCLITYRDDNFQLQGTTPVSIRWAGVIKSGSFQDQPTFVLNQDAQVFNIYRNDPNNSDRVWKGPTDLSAKTWLTATDSELKLRIVVADDKHVQAQPADTLWRSDSLQLVMLIPNQGEQWEITFARSNDGRSLVYGDIVPSDMDASRITASLLTTTVNGNEIVYELNLPLRTLGLSVEQLRCGIYLSLLVNEDDGQGRDGWIALSGGIGDGKDPGQYPLFVLR